MAAPAYPGHCLCGTIRYRADGAPLWVASCHCASCRRAAAAPMVTYAGFARERFRYLSGQPKRYHSSPGVTWSFCGACGSLLTYEGARWPGEIHATVCTLDQPESLPPDRHAMIEEKLPWLHLPAIGAR